MDKVKGKSTPPPENPPALQAPEQSSSTPPYDSKMFLIPPIIAVLVVLLGVGYLVGAKISSPQTPSVVTPQITPYPTPTPDPTANWKTYRNEKLGFEFKYPQARGDYPLRIQEEYGSVTLMHLTYPDLLLITNKAQFINYKSLKPCSNYTSEEISKKPITCLASGEYYGQKELVKEIELSRVRAVSFFPNTFSEGSLSWVIQTIDKPFVQITSSVFSKKIFDQILSTFRFIE